MLSSMKNKSSQIDFLKRLRKLEIGKCYISNDLTTAGEGHVIICRSHKGGNITVAFFLLDIYCIGVKDTFMKKRMPPIEFTDILDSMGESIQECKYEEAHN